MKKLLAITLLILSSCFVFAQDKKLTLLKDGKSDYVIIIPKDFNKKILYAAELFQKDVEKVTGCLLPIITDNNRTKKKEICIGFTNRSKSNINGLDYGYKVFTEKDKVFINGQEGNVTGEENSNFVVYAVIDLLEKHLGIRKFTEDCEIYPQKKDIIIDINDLNYSFSPRNTYRQVRSQFTRRNPDFRLWLKQHLQEDMFAEGYFVHTFEKLVPRAVYFENHPEYYSLINGKRMHDQLCLTNPEVLNIIIDKLKEEMVKQPNAKVWSVSQTDNFSYCSCDKCREINEREESPSGALISFVNKVAIAFPDKTISTLAYQYSRKAPKNTKPEKNVQIMLCTIEEDRNKTIEDIGIDALKSNPNTQTFAQDIEDWGKITDNIFLWDYEVNFAYSVSPFPNLHVLKPNIEFFIKNHAYQHFQQANSDYGHEFAELKTYLISKLLWNIDIDKDSIINEFLEGYYGKASKFIRQYIDTLQYYGEKSKVFLDIYAPPTDYANSFLSQDKVDIYSNLFQLAEEAVKNQPEYLLRVKTAKLPLSYAIMEIGKADMFGERGWYYKDGNGKYMLKENMNNMIEEFYLTSKDAKVLNLNESNLSPKEYYESTKRFINISVENNTAFRKNVIAYPKPSPLYSLGEMSTITNGVNGDSEYKIHWLGWNGIDFSLVLDIEKEVKDKTIKLSSLYFPKSWILHPQKVECYVSKDGKDYMKIGEVIVGSVQKDEEIIREYIFPTKDIDFRYLKFEIESTKELPYWHPSEGAKSWVFLDEIIVE